MTLSRLERTKGQQGVGRKVAGAWFGSVLCEQERRNGERLAMSSTGAAYVNGLVRVGGQTEVDADYSVGDMCNAVVGAGGQHQRWMPARTHWSEKGVESEERDADRWVLPERFK
jgi:hypothetical protein